MILISMQRLQTVPKYTNYMHFTETNLHKKYVIKQVLSCVLRVSGSDTSKQPKNNYPCISCLVIKKTTYDVQS